MSNQLAAAVYADTVSASSTAYDWAVTYASEQSATPLVPLGTVTMDIYGREWMYCRSEGGSTAGYLNTITTDGNFDATLVTTTTAGTAGTNWKLLGAPNIDVTDEYCAWYWIGYGTFELVIENGFAAGDVVYTTATAGIAGADDTSFQIEGLKTIDEGVTATRVTVWAAGRLTVGVVEAHD
jgi:hypothetical protein